MAGPHAPLLERAHEDENDGITGLALADLRSTFKPVITVQSDAKGVHAVARVVEAPCSVHVSCPISHLDAVESGAEMWPLIMFGQVHLGSDTLQVCVRVRSDAIPMLVSHQQNLSVCPLTFVLPEGLKCQ